MGMVRSSVEAWSASRGGHGGNVVSQRGLGVRGNKRGARGQRGHAWASDSSVEALEQDCADAWWQRRASVHGQREQRVRGVC